MNGYVPIEGAAGGIALALVGGAVWAADRWHRRHASSSRESHGSSRWAGRGDLGALLRGAESVDGAVVGWRAGKVIRLPDEDNLLVFGVQRSGKTSTVIVPTLLSWPGAAVATSTKEELVTLTGRHRRRQGPVYVFAPLDDDHGWVTKLDLEPVSWNPLSEIRGSGSAGELADVFTAEGKASHSPHWYHSAANLLTGMFLLGNFLEGDMAMVLDFLNSMPPGGFGVLGTQAGGRAQAILEGFSHTPPQEAGSIVSTARASLSIWLDERVAKATAAKSGLPDLNLDRLLSEGGALYLVAPAEDAERCRPLFTALLGGLLRRATARARQDGGILRPRLLLALDEAANFARVPRLPSYVSTGPGQGIQSLLCFHDLAQIRTGYGPDGASTIWNNCRARLLLPGQGDLNTLELFSKSLGVETVSYRLRNWNRDGSSSGESRTGRPLATPDELRRSDHAVLLYGSERPAQLQLRRWDQVPQWRALVQTSSQPAATAAG
jgi:type IV secretory pathway TraG/TraD family ATPase VirD4